MISEPCEHLPMSLLYAVDLMYMCNADDALNLQI